ncbi:MAG TPA: DUF4837 family protein, partial [Candidatus Krumholzibacterium sp.]|nr:DUF4837 family protein [Candidatus Krumholzibacterium sp.]
REPHRGISVSWKAWNKSSLSLADSTALYNMRADFAWRMYDQDVMRREIVYFREERLGEYDTVRMNGYWENSKDTYGGPFICYFIQDKGRRKLWMVDCLAYGPGFDKHTLLRELRAVAETFRID